MKSSPIMSLFTTPPPVRWSPSSFLISMVLHAFAFALLFAGLNRPRKVDVKSGIDRYAVRVMELHREEQKDRWMAQKTIAAPGQHAGAQSAVPGGGPETAAAAQIPLNFITQKQAAQTLIQPDVKREIIIHQEAALPQIVQWSPPDNTLSKIVPPPPRPVATVKVTPTLDLPNQEMHVADLKLSASQFETKAPLPAPSKTSPVNVQSADQTQRVPETASKSSAHPTPASIISLSDIKMQEGTATLPMVNEVAPTPFSGSLTPGQANSQSPTGNGRAEGKQNGASAGQTAGNLAGKTGGAVGPAGQNGANGVGQNGANGQQQGEMDGGIAGNSQRSVVRVSQPKDGHFGVVVVGASLAEDYPETINMWRGRLAYTVYLHVGVSKNWILQYSLPRSQAADSSGSVVRPDAPWPYDMTRPSIDSDVNADAIMVHGFVNTLGRFEQLAVVFPTELTEAKFLLRALQQWQFRPATQNGQATQVEVLLIIPDETE